MAIGKIPNALYGYADIISAIFLANTDPDIYYGTSSADFIVKDSEFIPYDREASGLVAIIPQNSPNFARLLWAPGANFAKYSSIANTDFVYGGGYEPNLKSIPISTVSLQKSRQIGSSSLLQLFAIRRYNTPFGQAPYINLIDTNDGNKSVLDSFGHTVMPYAKINKDNNIYYINLMRMFGLNNISEAVNMSGEPTVEDVLQSSSEITRGIKNAIINNPQFQNGLSFDLYSTNCVFLNPFDNKFYNTLVQTISHSRQQIPDDLDENTWINAVDSYGYNLAFGPYGVNIVTEKLTLPYTSNAKYDISPLYKMFNIIETSYKDDVALPNVLENDISGLIKNIEIPIPPEPYLPEGGGISGGGNESTSSDAIGSFNGTPGPSVAEGIPDGAVGSDIASSGMYTKYLCNANVLNVIAQYLWEDNVGIQALKAIIGNPIDSIISLISYPFALDSLVPVTSTKIYFGKYNSLLSASAITKSSIKIDWGTVEIPFFWGGFLDYSPYTQIQLYLPWGVGFVSLDPNEVMPWSPQNSYTQGSFTNGSVRVVTNIELDKGSCVHNVIGNNGRVIGSFGGICGKQVPVVGTNDAARTLALIGAAVSAGTTLGMAATGQPALGKGLAYGKNMSQMNRAEGREMLSDYNSAVSGMLASTRAAAKSPPTYPRAGTFSDATSHLAVQYPYLIISRPSQSMPRQYGRFMGYPSNIFHNHLGEVKGYTEVSSIHLDDIPATSTELDELESILKGGVLL